MNFTTYKVILSLFPEKGGGRKGAIFENYTPNSVFGFDIKDLSNIWNGSYYSYKGSDTQLIKNVGVIFKLSRSKVYPGGVVKAELKISKDAENYIGNELLKVGANFLIREGSRVVGTGQLVNLSKE